MQPPLPDRTHRRFLPLLLVSALALGGLLSAPTPTASAAPGPDVDGPVELFDPLPGFRLDRSRPATVTPSDFAAASIDLGAARRTLDGAAAGPSLISLPEPDGGTAVFSVSEDSVMEDDLQAAHPEIRTYAGRGVTDPERSVRLDLTPAGLHASVRSPGGQDAYYVDPAYRGAASGAYLSYFGAAVPREAEAFVERDPLDTGAILDAAPAARTAPGEVVTRRSFRLAFVTDPTYAAYFGETDDNVLAAKTTLVNRMNQVYNDDLAIRFLLIDGTDELNLATRADATQPDGPCGASACYDPDTFYSDGSTDADGNPDAPDGCTGALLDRNQFALGQLVGADAFDIGHIGLGVNGGGIAGLGVVGGADKAAGCTGLPFPTGDFYAIDYVAHEIGHQMGGNHTFNGNQVNCSLTNRNGDTSVEPGSGSSVMAYAGICGQDDLQPHTDPYFSQRSIDEITDTVTAAPAQTAETQTISLDGFDADGDSFTLGYPGATPVTVTRGNALAGGNYTNLQVANAIRGLTDCLPTVTGYDSTSPQLSDDGFTATFSACPGTDLQRLVLSPGTGGVTGFVGVQANGGPGTNAGTAAETANRAPRVIAPEDRTIPLRTPFTLTGSATDADGQPLTYLWEQNDAGPALPNGGTALVSNTKQNGPLFRVFGTRADVSLEDSLQSPSPGQNTITTSPSRTFPDLAQVLSDNTNAETGTCPAAPADLTADVPVATVDCYSEYLPTADYGDPLTGGAMTFRLTARDGFSTGGGTQYDDVTLTTDPATGPFQVTSRPTTGGAAEGGDSETVTWDVNGTDAAGLAPTVRISLSTDGGLSFPTVLSAATPNDGSESVTLPDVATSAARLKVEAVGNYFFDVNDADFVIRSSTPPDTSFTGGVARGAFVVGYRAAYRYTSDLDGVDYLCRLDGAATACGDGATQLRGLEPGDHVFTVAARDARGRVDPTPAVRRFSVVYNEQVLVRGKGWRSLRSPAAYRATYYRADTKGRELVVKGRQMRKLAVLVSRAPRLGRIAVFVGNERVKVINLRASQARNQVLVPVRTFSSPRNAEVTIRSLDNRRVVVDGIGIARR